LAINLLLAADLLLFAGGAIAHSGVPVRLGVGTWVEPLLVPAATIEGLGATGLVIALVGVLTHARWAYECRGGSCGIASPVSCGAWDGWRSDRSLRHAR
jgi:hypothetical protein